MVDNSVDTNSRAWGLVTWIWIENGASGFNRVIYVIVVHNISQYNNLND
jgi:hypothetical protein